MEQPPGDANVGTHHIGPIGPPQPLPEASDVFGQEGADAFMKQVFTVWLMPELERRKSAGKLTEPVELQAMQVMLRESEFAVRINREIRGNATVQATRLIGIGDEATEEDLKHIKFFELAPDELDCAHITMMLIKGRWLIFFNLLLNRAQSGKFVEHARAFLRVSRMSFEENLVGPCVDSLFSACELACKSHLMLAAHPSAKATKHSAIHSASNRGAKLGRIPAEFVALYNRLAELRPRARYSVGHADMLGVTIADLDLVTAELDDLAATCAERER